MSIADQADKILAAMNKRIGYHDIIADQDIQFLGIFKEDESMKMDPKSLEKLRILRFMYYEPEKAKKFLEKMIGQKG